MMIRFYHFLGAKALISVHHHFHPLSDLVWGWGWLIRVAWWTLPTGLRPCSGGNSRCRCRCSHRNLKHLGMNIGVLDGLFKWGFFWFVLLTFLWFPLIYNLFLIPLPQGLVVWWRSETIDKDEGGGGLLVEWGKEWLASPSMIFIFAQSR